MLFEARIEGPSLKHFIFSLYLLGTMGSPWDKGDHQDKPGFLVKFCRDSQNTAHTYSGRSRRPLPEYVWVVFWKHRWIATSKLWMRLVLDVIVMMNLQNPCIFLSQLFITNPIKIFNRPFLIP